MNMEKAWNEAREEAKEITKRSKIVHLCSTSMLGLDPQKYAGRFPNFYLASYDNTLIGTYPSNEEATKAILAVHKWNKNLEAKKDVDDRN